MYLRSGILNCPFDSPKAVPDHFKSTMWCEFCRWYMIFKGYGSACFLDTHSGSPLQRRDDCRGMHYDDVISESAYILNSLEQSRVKMEKPVDNLVLAATMQ